MFIIIFTVTSFWIYRALMQKSFMKSCPERKKKITKSVIKMLIIMQVVFTMLVLPYDIFDCTMLISIMIKKPIWCRLVFWFIVR